MAGAVGSIVVAALAGIVFLLNALVPWDVFAWRKGHRKDLAGVSMLAGIGAALLAGWLAGQDEE